MQYVEITCEDLAAAGLWNLANCSGAWHEREAKRMLDLRPCKVAPSTANGYRGVPRERIRTALCCNAISFTPASDAEWARVARIARARVRAEKTGQQEGAA